MNAIASKRCPVVVLLLGFVMTCAVAAVAQEDSSAANARDAGYEGPKAPVEKDSVNNGDSGGEAQAKDHAQRHVLIVIGISGDEEHHERFQQTVDVWRQWLIQIAGVERENMTILCSDDESDDTGPATGENIAEVVAQLEAHLDTDDSLWVFLLGHGSQDKRHAWFHLPGTDLSAAEWAGLFSKIRASEQVFWMTHAASGSFIKPMSLPNRIVISAADADGEVNETRFPHVLAEVMNQQLGNDDDQAKPGSIPSSLLDLFRTTTERVSQAFDAEQLVPTEHAQLDDNGDGVGAELADLATLSDAETSDQPESSPSLVDGMRAGRVSFPQKAMTEPKADLPESIDPLTSPANRKP